MDNSSPDVGSRFEMEHSMEESERKLKITMERSHKSSLDSDKKSTSYSDLPRALSFLKWGNCSIDNRDYETAIEQYKKCLKGAEEKSVKMVAYFSLGNAYILSDKMEEGLNCFNECLNFSSIVESKYFQHKVYFGLESVHSTTNRLDDGIKKKEIDSLCHVALGGLNKLSRNYKQSLEHYKKGFSLIESLYKQEIQLSQQENPQHRQKKVGGINVSKDFIDHNIKNLSIITSTGIMNGVLVVYWELAELFDKLEQWDDATRIYEIYFEIARKDEDIEKQTNVVKRLIQMYEKEERYAVQESMKFILQELDEKKKNKELQLQEWKYIGESTKHRDLILKLIEYGRDSNVDFELVSDVGVIFSNEFCIGKGSDGTRVYVGLGKDGYGKAVKRIRRDNCMKLAQNEKTILSQIKSNFVVHYYRFDEESAKDYVHLILDLCEESLESFVTSESTSLAYLQKSLPKIFTQILKGLADLHKSQNPILHLDLKPSNVLRDAQDNFLITDFGVSRILKNGLKTLLTGANKGTLYWIPPESYYVYEDKRVQARYKKESDVMSAGMVAYYVVTKGKHPFGSMKYRLYNMMRGNPVGLKEINNVELKDLLTWMLQLKPELRPSANKALKHPYLQSNNDKLDLLCNVTYPLDTEIPNLNHPLYEDVREQVNRLKNWKDRLDFKTSNNVKKEDYESTWLGCLKFIQDFHQDNKPRLQLSQSDDNYKEYLLQVFPELPLLVNRIVRLCDWKSRSVVGKHFTYEAVTKSQVWRVKDMNRFRRFLVLGNCTSTFYVNEKSLGLEHEQVLSNLMEAGRGVEVVNEIEKYSIEGRTARQQAIVFSLAVCARKGDLATKRQAYNALPKICQIPTHLFMFIKFCKYLSQSGCGWSRAHKNAIKRWYKEKDPWKLAMDITKYQKREGWSHRDVARLMHLKSEGTDVSDELFVIMKYVVCGWQKLFKYFFPEDKTTPRRPVGENGSAMLVFLRAVEEVKTLQEEARVVELINQHNLVREHIPTHFLNSKEVWNALLKKMPMTAMIRNLNKMTSIGLLAEGSPRVKEVCDKLRDEDLLMNARIHPFNMLLALATYQSGESENVSLELKANEEIIKVLEEAFYLSFKTVEPTGKRYMLAMDVSGSMQSSRCVGSSPVRSHMASAAMAMMTARTEQHCKVVAFSHEIVLIGISSSMKLNEILSVINEIPKGGRDCAQPMLYAIDKNLKIDVFIVYTDSEPYHGKVHPREALKQYRHQSGIDDAKLIVVAMTSNGFTIADPDDSGMLDIVGFDSTAPQVMREFILGNF